MIEGDSLKRIVLIGNNSGMETLCDFFCAQDNIRVVGLIHSDKEGSSQIAQSYASKYGIKRLRHPLRNERYDYENFLVELNALKPDLAICYSYDRILDKAFLDVMKRKVYNLHGALLPRYRGQNVLNWVLVNGETLTGMTLHLMDEGIDSGPIVYQKEISIDFEDTAVTLKNKMNAAAQDLLNRFLPNIIDDNIPVREQNENDATYFHKRRPADGEFFWNWSPIRIYNMIRALVYPWPGAYYMENDEKHVINQFIKYDDVMLMRKKHLELTKEH